MKASVIPTPRVKAALDRVRTNITQVIKGKDQVVERVLIGLLAGGHLLMEDLPGLGKTTLAYSLARSIDCDFARVQFTSDLLPSDVIGVSVYDERQREFVFKRGPLFTNILLADEINRTTPKTQSALLEAMDRGKVSVDGQTHAVGEPFMVFATQNPVDYEGTFPLPESQMDRFLLRLEMGYPQFEDELRILQRGFQHYDAIPTEPVITREEVLELQGYVQHVFCEPTVLDYLLKIVSATRTESEFRAGVSTRGSIALKTAAQACALLRGRSFITPQDVADMVPPVLAHRLTLHRPATDSLEAHRLVEAALHRILDHLPQPV
ncbi:MAG: MoxR family ATPase [Verrucomicrobiota bacterium JB022]|nr:MoxR family ATPase [Verrucomicrobiota bacterium JB022]